MLVSLFTFSQISIADSFWQRLEAALDDSADMECEFRINLINFFKDKSSWVYRTWFAHGCMKIALLVHNFRKYLPALKLDFSCCFANCTSQQIQYYEENRFCIFINIIIDIKFLSQVIPHKTLEAIINES